MFVVVVVVPIVFLNLNNSWSSRFVKAVSILSNRIHYFSFSAFSKLQCTEYPTESLFAIFIDPSSISVDGRKTSCTRDEMQLTLDRLTYPWLHQKYFDMHLIDDNCRPYHVNFTHIIVKTTYRECKTMKINSADGVIYRNTLMAFVKAQPGELVTRVPDVLFPFQCRFDDKKMTSIPSKKDVKITSPKGN